MLTADMIKKEIGGYFDEIVSFRRHLHMHPETGLDTKDTEAYIRSFLEGEGVGVLESQVGVIGCIKGGKSSGCCVALRADMDALPLAEENEVPYKSQVPGKCRSPKKTKCRTNLRFPAKCTLADTTDIPRCSWARRTC